MRGAGEVPINQSHVCSRCRVILLSAFACMLSIIPATLPLRTLKNVTDVEVKSNAGDFFLWCETKYNGTTDFLSSQICYSVDCSKL